VTNRGIKSKDQLLDELGLIGSYAALNMLTFNFATKNKHQN